MVRVAVLLTWWLAATSGATPLEPSWQVAFRGNCDSAMFVRDGQLALLRDRDLIPVDAARGTLGKHVALHGTHPNVQHGRSWDNRPNAGIVDGVLAIDGGGWIGGYDPHTGDELWWRDPHGGGIPTLVRADNELVLATPSYLGKDQPTIEVEALDPHTGHARWHVALPYELGQLNHVVVDATRIYVTSDGSIGDGSVGPTLVALDRKTGKLVWKHIDPAGFEVVSSTAGVVAVVGRKELRVLDPATGKERRRIGVAMHAFAIRDHRAFVATGDATETYDLATGARGWSHKLAVSRALVVDAAAVLVLDEASVVRALDLADGTELARWGVAGQTLVYLRDDESAPMAVLCGSQKLTALDPSAPPRPIEHATITGTVVCDGCTRETGRPNEVSIGDQVVPLVHGKFHVELDGRGIIPVSAALPDMSVVSEGIRWDYRACDTVLELVGKRVYRLTCTMRLRENHF